MVDAVTKERNERFKRICQRAEEMWERAGRPMDKHDVFWEAAMTEIDAGVPASHDQPAIILQEPLFSRAVTAIDHITRRTGDSPVVERYPRKGVKMHSSRL